jgi:hypothetical protein
MTEELIETANAHVAQYASTQDGGLCVPNSTEVLAEYWKVLAEKHEYNGIMSKTKSKYLFLPHLRYVRIWNISLKRMNRILFEELVCLIMGEIPVSSHDTDDTAEFTAEITECQMFELPRRDKRDRTDVEAHRDARRVQFKANADKFRDVTNYLSDRNSLVKVNRRDRIAWRRYDNVMESLGL